jgi:uncharacterized protein YciI
MTDSEAAVMEDHGAYWARHVADGVAIAFGPVMDPAGNWGLAVVEVETEGDVLALRDADPAVTSGLATAEIFPMPVVVARPGAPRP